MSRPASWDLKRQITYTKTIRKNTITKHEAKLAAFDQKITELQTKLEEALEADTASAT